MGTALDELSRVKGSAKPPLANTEEARRIELTYHSNAIEGNTLTLADTHLVVTEGLAPASSGKSLREVYEARNHDRALRMLESWLSSGSQDPLTEHGMLTLHEAILTDIMPQSAGRLRSQRVRISGSRHIPPGHTHFDDLLPPMLELANDASIHPVLRAAEIHYNVAAVHPFDDGNGRTARLMMNAVLMQTGYPLCIIPHESRAEYIGSLEQAHTQGNLEPFAELIVKCVRDSFGD